MKKIFVVDTNVLLHDRTALDAFADNTVILPMAVIEELDRFKKETNELGRNARSVVRQLDLLRSRGKLGEGVALDNGGILKIVTSLTPLSDEVLDVDIADNRIIQVAYQLHRQGERVIFVTKDINARIKADALGIEAMDFENKKVNFDELFTGYRALKVSGSTVDEFLANRSLPLSEANLMPNEFVTLIDEVDPKHTAFGRFMADGQLLALNAANDTAWHIKPRSREQRMTLELLLDDSIQVVTLVGQAGTGKTLLALAAGLEKTIVQKRYDKMLVTRPIMPFGRDIGFLPGDKEETCLV